MEPFIAQITLFGGNFAPRGWALCDGQLLAINEYQALFSILGTNFGGDGRTTFGLPDLRGRVPMHAGDGPGLSPRRIGQKFGAEQVNLMESQIPAHSHGLNVFNGTADNDRPQGDMLARSTIYSATIQPTAELNSASISSAGGSQAHENIQPSLCINYIIALQGIFPSRN
ncbi:phage tail protein [Palleronia caenipelagi]|uniref:Phage tail protein n=1 Tax=Palleronia caenipelagi TaxID=2489174 RepID=A0A547PJK2_9RHOB|nr:tail fiber protein [Palleronia caenipelagi]TRD14194.1 phage tail protein [Palleronia caenipelagi]